MNGNSRQLPTPEAQRKPLSFDILMIGVISLLAIGSWVVFDVYRSLTKTTVPRVLQKQIRPLQSTIDPQLFADIKLRRRFTQQQLNSVTPKPYVPPEERSPAPTALPSPAFSQLTATPTPSPATASATISPTPESTQSGTITL